MKYEHVGFNVAWVASQKLEDFIKHESHHGFKDEQLKEVHRLCRLKYKESSFKTDSIPEAGNES